MPQVRHFYTFICVRCNDRADQQLNDDDYKTGRVNVNDVTSRFNFGASLDFSNLNVKGAYNMYLANGEFERDATGDLCDECLMSLVEWFKPGKV